MLTRQQKLFLMFTPLIVGFVALFMVIQDLKHPSIDHDQCMLVGRGRALAEFKMHARVLYTRSGKPEDDLGFHCHQLGSVVVNDVVHMPLNHSEPIELTIKTFHYMPTRYAMSIPVVNPSKD